ncbi:hypothetical protein WJX81_006178 [Elliptochloris bilobata]|uniref:Serine incorporator n=1 Tax=Elliptochloris bilobata TaxID=381761 RepID=A0AAW1SJS6_9CHLO
MWLVGPLANICLHASPSAVKYIYFSGFVLSAVASWLLRDYGQYVVSHAGSLAKCLHSGTQAVCIGKGAILRVSFGNFLFFGAHALALAGVHQADNPRLLLHTGLWPVQLCAWALLAGSSFAMPNAVLLGYRQLARVLAGAFLVLQVVLLLDCVYATSKWLTDHPGPWRIVALVAGTVLLYVGALAVIGMLFHFYAPAPSCRLNIFFIGWTLILGICYTFLSITPCRAPNAGLLTAGTVFAYSTMLLWGALSSEPVDGTCVLHSGTGSNGLKIAGFFAALASVLVSTVNSSSESGSFSVSAVPHDAGELPYRPDFFHTVFMLASAYLAMLFTAWSLDGVQEGTYTLDADNWVSPWVKMASQWLCAALYVWSLVAHLVLRGRSFA